MSRRSMTRNRTFVLTGLGIALLIGVFLSPFASQHPDGLNRVAEDLGFSHRETQDAPTKRLPSTHLFDGYALKGVPEHIATPIAGLVGTLVVFGIAWGAGKLLVKGNAHTKPHSDQE